MDSNLILIQANFHLHVRGRNPSLFTSEMHMNQTKIRMKLSLANENVIVSRCSHEQGEFISNHFNREKKNGGIRLILDLAELNKSIAYHHFKMDNIYPAVALLREGIIWFQYILRGAHSSRF